ncbi:MAG: hypothetical protein HY760_07805, partial [Nitrospirae bacterium]|nr:hypothetical protein [Nitrospirota bacterium]
GEGYHNFHHQFQYDYRNGIRWYQWDPTKWVIKGMEILGWAKQLRTASDEQIFKAQLRVQNELAQRWLAKHSGEHRTTLEGKVQEAYHALLTARAQWERLKSEYREMKGSVRHKKAEVAARLREEIRIAQEHFQVTHKNWAFLVQDCLGAPATA